MNQKQAIFQLTDVIAYEDVYEKLNGHPNVSSTNETRKGLIKVFFDDLVKANVTISPQTGGLQILYAAPAFMQIVLRLFANKGLLELQRVRPVMLEARISLDFVLPCWQLVSRKENWTTGYIGIPPEGLTSGVRVLSETWQHTGTKQTIFRFDDRFLDTKVTPEMRKQSRRMEAFVRDVNRLGLLGKSIVLFGPQVFVVRDGNEFWLVDRKTGKRQNITDSLVKQESASASVKDHTFT
jgi:hypothetical protein